MLHVVHQHGFRDLDLELLRREAEFVERTADRFEDAGPELRGRDVHGDARQRETVGGPGCQLETCLADDPAPDRDDQAGFFRDRDEAGRRDVTSDRMRPAQQGLGTDQPAVGDVELRLVVEHELAPFERDPEIAFERQAFDGPRVHPGEVEAVAVAAGCLRRMHRDVGVFHQFVGVATVVGEHADADAARHVEHVAGRPDGFGDLAQQFLGDVRGILGDAQAGARHGELVVADPGDEVAAGEHGVQASAEPDDQVVAGVVTERFVDELEAVDVDEQEGELLAVAAAVVEFLEEQFLEGATVGQAGQLVAGRDVLGACLGAACLRDVDQQEAQAPTRAAVGDALHAAAQPDGFALRAHHPQLDGALDAVLGASEDEVHRAAAIVLVDRLVPEAGLVAPPRQSVAEQAFGAARDVVDLEPRQRDLEREAVDGIDQGFVKSDGAAQVALGAGACARLALHRDELPAQLEPRDDLVRQDLEHLREQRRQRARHVVDHAERAERVAVAVDQRCACVEADLRLRDDERVVAEAIVGEGVPDDHHLVGPDGVVAERDVARRGFDVESDAGLEPLAVGVEQRQQRDRRVADERGQPDDLVEFAFGRRVHDGVARERTLALELHLGRLRRRDHGRRQQRAEQLAQRVEPGVAWDDVVGTGARAVGAEACLGVLRQHDDRRGRAVAAQVGDEAGSDAVVRMQPHHDDIRLECPDLGRDDRDDVGAADDRCAGDVAGEGDELGAAFDEPVEQVEPQRVHAGWSGSNMHRGCTAGGGCRHRRSTRGAVGECLQDVGGGPHPISPLRTQ